MGDPEGVSQEKIHFGVFEEGNSPIPMLLRGLLSDG